MSNVYRACSVEESERATPFESVRIEILKPSKNEGSIQIERPKWNPSHFLCSPDMWTAEGGSELKLLDLLVTEMESGTGEVICLKTYRWKIFYAPREELSTHVVCMLTIYIDPLSAQNSLFELRRCSGSVLGHNRIRYFLQQGHWPTTYSLLGWEVPENRHGLAFQELVNITNSIVTSERNISSRAQLLGLFDATLHDIEKKAQTTFLALLDVAMCKSVKWAPLTIYECWILARMQKAYTWKTTLVGQPLRQQDLEKLRIPF